MKRLILMTYKEETAKEIAVIIFINKIFFAAILLPIFY